MAMVHSDGASTPLIDASVHIFFRSNTDFRGFLREPYRSRGIPDVTMDWWGRPGGEYAEAAIDAGEDHPASDPDITGHQLFERRGADVAIPVSYTHLRAHETRHDLVCRLLLEKKKKKQTKKKK